MFLWCLWKQGQKKKSFLFPLKNTSWKLYRVSFLHSIQNPHVKSISRPYSFNFRCTFLFLGSFLLPLPEWERPLGRGWFDSLSVSNFAPSCKARVAIRHWQGQFAADDWIDFLTKKQFNGRLTAGICKGHLIRCWGSLWLLTSLLNGLPWLNKVTYLLECPKQSNLQFTKKKHVAQSNSTERKAQKSCKISHRWIFSIKLCATSHCMLWAEIWQTFASRRVRECISDEKGLHIPLRL